MAEAKIALTGRIDSNNAPRVEQDMLGQLAGLGQVPVVLDAQELQYISSAGLRVILRLKKNYPDLTITNVNSEVYEILDMTGFTEMMTVEKAYRVVDVEGCEEIGRGANGTIYRIDMDNVVKVYNNADALEEIQHEREVARLALILGIPTAISYDVVRVGESYGSVFELLNARSFSKILATEPEKMDWCVKEYVELLKKIHGTEVPEGKLPDMKETVTGWARFMQDYLPEGSRQEAARHGRSHPGGSSHDPRGLSHEKCGAHGQRGPAHRHGHPGGGPPGLRAGVHVQRVHRLFRIESGTDHCLPGLRPRDRRGPSGRRSLAEYLSTENEQDPGGRGQGPDHRLYPADSPLHPPQGHGDGAGPCGDRALDQRTAGAACTGGYTYVFPQ